jgi:hypothetical protein
MKKLFAASNSKNLINTTTAFDTKETVIDLNNVKIEAFPSHHLDAMLVVVLVKVAPAVA